MTTPGAGAPPSPLSRSATEAIALPAKRAVWSYVGGLAPVVIVWALLVGWLAKTLYDRATWSEEADAATVREWLDEARNFRKALPELVREYVRLREEDPAGTADPKRLVTKRAEIEEHMRSLAEPTRTYQNQLPSFPEIYQIEVIVEASGTRETFAWVSPLPRPRRQSQTTIRELSYRPLGDADGRAVIRCDYRLHAFNRLQREEEDHRRQALVAGALLIAATLLAGLFVTRFLRRERQREVQRLTAVAEAEHHEREAERVKHELNEKLLRQKLDAADLERRAAEAEKTALEMKSQLYAGIGIMAGSYAHNIKNLLVRPNDLLARCIEVNGLSPQQEGMLHEVKHTLGTVTERLQQILRTVRRDPTDAELTRIDLNQLVGDTARTWAEMGWEKWKLKVTADLADGPLWVRGDLSHLQQAVENLVFNARDATFEMRNHHREEARKDHSPDRKQRLIEAAGWKGEVRLTTRRTAGGIVLEVRDNGVGMSDEVRASCLRTHFTTKRDNALYEGYSAGMGLGLSFVAMVLEHHGARLEIESEPHRGATFRMIFPPADGDGPT
jgi:signal transduction histidine kinase